MSTLEEIKTSDLFEELVRRIRCGQDGVCPYCDVDIETHTCKLKDKLAEHYGTPIDFIAGTTAIREALRRTV